MRPYSMQGLSRKHTIQPSVFLHETRIGAARVNDGIIEWL
jgi:hypothetical protein